MGCVATRAPIEVADRIISCAGPSQALDVALLMLEGVIGEDQVAQVRRYMTGTDSTPETSEASERPGEREW